MCNNFVEIEQPLRWNDFITINIKSRVAKYLMYVFGIFSKKLIYLLLSSLLDIGM